METTLAALYNDLRKSLRDVSDTPDLDARLLIAHAFSCAPDDVLFKPDMGVNASHAVYTDAVSRRMKHEPVAKIIGHREFYGHDFVVNRDVLDPRPDTETLVDEGVKFLRTLDTPRPDVLDMCCGSACILVSVLHLFPQARGTGADKSDAALRVAAENLTRHGMDARATLVQSDYFSGLEGVFDCILCNPPYIPSQDIESLDSDVKNYDPALALDGGESGLCAYEILFPQIRNYLKDGGRAFFEFGAGQEGDVGRLAQNCGLTVHGWYRDLGGHVRVVCVA